MLHYINLKKKKNTFLKYSIVPVLKINRLGQGGGTTY